MGGFEPGSSGFGSNRSANCAITTAPKEKLNLRKHYFSAEWPDVGIKSDLFK